MFNFFKKRSRRKADVLTCIYIECTGEYSPTQYEGTLSDGRMFVARFRQGRLIIELSQFPTDNVLHALGGELIYYFDSGEKHLNFMHASVMTNHLGMAGIGFPPEGLPDCIF